jgi:membrane protein
MNVSVVELAKNTWQEFGKDNVGRLGAALAYYTFTSFFPLLLVLISLVGIALSLGFESAEDARTTVLNAVESNLPAARDLLAESFRDTEQNAGSLGIVGLLTGLWAASGVFAQLDQAFSVIFDISPRKRTIIENLKARGQAALIVIIIAALLIGSLVFGTVLTTVDSVARSLPGGAIFGFVINIAVSLILSTGVFAMLFKFLPDKPVTWKAALLGGAFASVTWQIGRELLTWWLGRASNEATAGTVVGSVLAFLALVYYASQIIMLGAELTATYDEMAHPEKVRHKTSEDSPMPGPGQPAVDEGGNQIEGTGSAGTASNGQASKEEKSKSGSGDNQQASRSRNSQNAATAASPDAQERISTFGTGFVGGVLASLITGRIVVGKVVNRVLHREES